LDSTGEHRVAILQPSYLPWLGAFDLMARCDSFVFHDDVQYTKQDWRNRNRIKSAQGWRWLTVPVEHAGTQALIRDVRICYATDWVRDHLNLLRESYRRAPHFEAILAVVGPCLEARPAFLRDLCVPLMVAVADRVGIRPRFFLASDLAQPGRRQEKVLNLCAALGATHYLNGAAGRAIYDPAAFAARGITLEFQVYRHPVYSQGTGHFIPHLSAVDLLCHHGPAAREILLAGGGPPPEAVPAPPALAGALA
jgi:hypothetical protein